MVKDASRPLAELHRERARQDAIWSRVKEELQALGDVTLVLPESTLEAIDRAFTRGGSKARAAMVPGALRG